MMFFPNNVKDQLIQNLKKCRHFSLVLGELHNTKLTMNSLGKFCFKGLLNLWGNINPLPKNQTDGVDIFESFTSVREEFQVDMENLIFIVTDGSLAMLGQKFKYWHFKIRGWWFSYDFVPLYDTKSKYLCSVFWNRLWKLSWIQSLKLFSMYTKMPVYRTVARNGRQFSDLIFFANAFGWVLDKFYNYLVYS